MSREDNLAFAITGATGFEDLAFDLEPLLTKHQFKHFYERFSLQYEMNKDVEKVDRVVYNSFMLLGDVGGLYGILVPLVSTLLGFLNFQKSENKLVQELYSLETTLEAAKQSVIREIMQSCSQRCLRRNRREELFEKARSHLNDDLDVVTLLKKLRLFDLAIRKVVTAEDLADFKISLEKLSDEVENSEIIG